MKKTMLQLSDNTTYQMIAVKTVIINSKEINWDKVQCDIGI